MFNSAKKIQVTVDAPTNQIIEAICRDKQMTTSAVANALICESLRETAMEDEREYLRTSIEDLHSKMSFIERALIEMNGKHQIESFQVYMRGMLKEILATSTTARNVAYDLAICGMDDDDAENYMISEKHRGDDSAEKKSAAKTADANYRFDELERERVAANERYDNENF